MLVFFMQVWPRAKRIALLLAPLALAAGLALRWTRPAPPPLAVACSHVQFVQRARGAALAAGVNGSGWTPSFKLHQNEGAVRRAARGADSLDARLKPLASITVTLKDPDSDKSFEARFNQAGDLLSWSTHGMNVSANPQTAMDELLKPFGPATLSGSGETGMEYKRLAIFPGSSQKYPVRVELEGGRPVSASLGDAEDSDGYGANILEKILEFCGYSLTGFFLFYSLRLFRRRRLEGEVPRERALLLIAIFGLCGFLFAALNPDSFTLSGGLATLLAVGMAILSGLGKSILFMLGGLFVAAPTPVERARFAKAGPASWSPSTRCSLASGSRVPLDAPP